MIKRLKRLIYIILVAFSSQNQYISILRNRGALIGEGCYIDKNVLIPEPTLIRIGNKCRITRGSTFITHDGSIWTLRNLGLQASNIDMGGVIHIGDNVHIGNNVIILPNVRIGNNCIIGAGAVVAKSIPNNSVAIGCPAKVIKTVEEFNENNMGRMHKLKGLNEMQRADFLWNEFNKNNMI